MNPRRGRSETLRAVSAFGGGVISWALLFDWRAGRFHAEMESWIPAFTSLVLAGLIGGFRPIKEWFAVPLFAACGSILTQLVITLGFLTTRDSEIIPLLFLAMIVPVVIIGLWALFSCWLYHMSRPRQNLSADLE